MTDQLISPKGASRATRRQRSQRSEVTRPPSTGRRCLRLGGRARAPRGPAAAQRGPARARGAAPAGPGRAPRADRPRSRAVGQGRARGSRPPRRFLERELGASAHLGARLARARGRPGRPARLANRSYAENGDAAGAHARERHATPSARWPFRRHLSPTRVRRKPPRPRVAALLLPRRGPRSPSSRPRPRRGRTTSSNARSSAAHRSGEMRSSARMALRPRRARYIARRNGAGLREVGQRDTSACTTWQAICASTAAASSSGETSNAARTTGSLSDRAAMCI